MNVRLKLGLDCYTLRWQGWGALQLIEYCGRQRLDICHFGRENLPTLDPGYLATLKRRADELHVSLEIGMNSFNRFSKGFRLETGTGEAKLAEMLRAAPLVGSRIVRCFVGSQSDRSGPVPIEQQIEEGLRALRVVAPLARDLGVKLAVENHGDLLARELAALVEAAGPDSVGVCLDLGNPVLAAEDPVMTTEILARYTVTSHFRDSRVWMVADGAMVQHVPMGQGDVDFHRVIALLSDQAPEAAVNLEILTGGPPRLVPCLDPAAGFWDRYRIVPARDFVRFLALARRRTAAPFAQLLAPPGIRAVPEGELGAQLIAQQRRHLEESIEYSRAVLGLGVRGRVDAPQPAAAGV